jgi:hypothetical protein
MKGRFKLLFSIGLCKLKVQRGEILLTTLIFVLLGFLIIVPLVTLMGTSLKTARVISQKNAALYTADAGIEDGIWQIKYDQLKGKFSTYDPHDYTSSWSYNLPSVNGRYEVNNINDNVTIRNIWVVKDIVAPDNDAANSIVNDSNFYITGGTYGASSYNIVITYYPGQGEVLKVNTVGIWLPPGYTYKPGSSNMGSEPSTSGHQGGQSVIWSLSTVNFTSLPGVVSTKSPLTANITFSYLTATALTSGAAIGSTTLSVSSTTGFPNTGTISLNGEPFPIKYSGITSNSFTGIPASGNYSITMAHSSGETVGLGIKPEAVAWVNTSNVSGISYAWDDTVRVFHINSKADSTSIDSYISKSTPRKIGRSQEGDYYATGNSLMRDLNSDGVKETRTNSSAIAAAPNPSTADNGIPDDANISAAYLYWGTWYISDNWASKWSVTNSNRCHTLLSDTCDHFNSGGDTPTYYWDNGANPGYNIYSFRAKGNNSAENSTSRDLTKYSSFAIDTTAYPSSEWIFTLSWEQWYSGTAPTATDGLDFYISTDGGTSWNGPIEAFRGSAVGTSYSSVSAVYQYNIPTPLLSSNFKIKYHVVGFNVSNQYVYIDDIRLNTVKPDPGLTFKINNGSGDKTVYFDSNGNPLDSSNPANQVTCPNPQVILTYSFGSGSPEFTGFSQACTRDVTALVIKYSTQPVSPATNFNGHATYSAVGDLGDTGSSSNAYQLAHAGWSLVLVYTGPETLGHQLYLWDNFFGSGNDSDGIHITWNGDGSSGGTVKGFVVPQQIEGEINAAKMTCFVTEGDNALSGDYISMNGAKLWDGTSSTSNSKTSPNNVWNSKSYLSGGYSIYDGVDIDTLGKDPTASSPQYITWASQILKPGDTSATLDLYTKSDYWFMIYMIISFRSEITTGGALTYLIVG